jgi:hypothetical protein
MYYFLIHLVLYYITKYSSYGIRLMFSSTRHMYFSYVFSLICFSYVLWLFTSLWLLIYIYIYISLSVNVFQFCFSLSYTGPKILLYTFLSKMFNSGLSLFVSVQVSDVYVNLFAYYSYTINNNLNTLSILFWNDSNFCGPFVRTYGKTY